MIRSEDVTDHVKVCRLSASLCTLEKESLSELAGAVKAVSDDLIEDCFNIRISRRERGEEFVDGLPVSVRDSGRVILMRNVRRENLMMERKLFDQLWIVADELSLIEVENSVLKQDVFDGSFRYDEVSDEAWIQYVTCESL